MPWYGPRWSNTFPSKTFGTKRSLHSGSTPSSAPMKKESVTDMNSGTKARNQKDYSPVQATAFPPAPIWISPLGCLKPSPRPGTVGTGSRLLFTLLNSVTWESKSVAQAALPTRGVPNVMPWTLVPAGRLSFIYNASSSASAPPSEWPIYVRGAQNVSRYGVHWTR